MRDVIFRSAALNREMTYRVFLPITVPQGQKLKTVYLLHGGGGGFRDWSNYSDAAEYAAVGLLMVMPEGNSAYYTNSVARPQDRYEDYIVSDLISDVESRFPVTPSREARAIVGVSMGGFGSVKLGFRHPELYSFVGALSPAVDVPTRPFSIKRIDQWRFHSSIFGPSGSQVRHDNDPFALARAANPDRVPYFYLVCGDQEGLLAVNMKFAELLDSRHISNEFHVVVGGHNWAQWDKDVAGLFRSLNAHFSEESHRTELPGSLSHRSGNYTATANRAFLVEPRYEC